MIRQSPNSFYCTYTTFIPLKFDIVIGFALKPKGKLSKPEISIQGQSQGPLTNGEIRFIGLSLNFGMESRIRLKPKGKFQKPEISFQGRSQGPLTNCELRFI